MIKFYTTPISMGWFPHDGPPKKLFVESNTKVFQFPGGEMHVTGGETADEIPVLTGHDPKDLLALRVWADLRKRKGLSRKAIIPYLPAARQDRGEPLSAAVYADIINGGDFERVVCFDPHSDVMPALIKNCVIVQPKHVTAIHDEFNKKFNGIIAPDAGAGKRAFEMAQLLNVPMFQGLKHRNIYNGELSGFSCEPLSGRDHKFLIVDDICDGGGTFIGLMDTIKYPKESISLYVSHGIFSKGTKLLTDRFEKVYTTNTFEVVDTWNPNVHRIDVIEALICIARS